MKRKGFTLVELLVVISIIALLLAILMPSLSKAREQAKVVVDMANLKQLALCYNLYTNENKNCFDASFNWPVTLEPYFSNIDKLRCCPSAPGPSNPNDAKNATGSSYGGPKYGKKYWTWSENGFKPFQYGSYGLNCWLLNPVPGGWPPSYGNVNNLWRKSNQAGASNIPILADAYWMGGMPLQSDKPPILGDLMDNPLYSMQRFCSARHGGKTNVNFMDWSVRSVGLKQLWKLKWHKNYDVNAKEPDWSRSAWINKK